MPEAVAGVEAATKRYADATVLDAVTLGVADGDRLGVIGRNGAGKSTLLRLLARTEQPDRGTVTWRSGLRVRVVDQEPRLDGDTPLDAVLAGDAPGARAARAYERAAAAVRADPTAAAAQAALEAAGATMDADGGWDVESRARATLDHLGVHDPEGSLEGRSGGERKRVALARALIDEPDLLILDEPTNHLDVEVVEWLEDRLVSWAGTLALVTHDRWLLDAVATRVVEVVDAGLVTHDGGYASYIEAREVRRDQAAAEGRKRANRAKVELTWLRRNPKARTSKSKIRTERAAAFVAQTGPVEDAELEIDMPSRRLGGKVVNLHNAGVTFGERTVLRDIDWKLRPRERIGLVGPNGSGKTTLLRLLSGELEPTAGSVRFGETVHVATYRQDPRPLAPQTRVREAVQEVVRETELMDGTRADGAALLERFLFDRSAQRAYVEDLSGGQRRRLELLLTLADAPNVLLLDEPTNDLDLDTLAVLEEYLDAWPGVLIVATHDRYFLDRVCRDVHAIDHAGRLVHHPGGWAAYREAQIAQQTEARAAERAVARANAAPREVPPEPAEPRARKLTYNEQRELGALEARIPELESRRDELQDALVVGTTDHTATASLGSELTEVMTELDAAETRWLELSE